MSVRNKSRRRLAILLIAAVASVSALGGTYFGVKEYKKYKADISGTEGIAAFEAGDKHAALHKIGAYLGRIPASQDKKYIKALRMYATAREEIEEANGSHLSGALDAWRKLANVKPDDVEAHRKILKLYPAQGSRMLVEAGEAADFLLKKDSKDKEALLGLATINFQLRKLDLAAANAKALLDIDPLDLDGQFLLMQVMLARAENPQQIFTYVDTLPKPVRDGGRGVSSTDHRYLLIRAFAAGVANNIPEAEKCLLAAAAADVKDLAWLRRVVQLLDMHGKFDESLKLCEKAAQQNIGNSEFQRFFVVRLFEAGQYPQVLHHLADTKAESSGANGFYLALKAWSIVEQDNPTADQLAEARKIVDTLLGRVGSDRIGFGFASALRAVWPETFGDKQKPPIAADRVNDARQALASNGSPYIRYLLAETLRRTDDMQGAFEQYKTLLTDQVPAWGLPRIRAAQLVHQAASAEGMATRQAETAAVLAREGVMRSPASIQGQITHFLARALNLSKQEELAAREKTPAPADAAQQRAKFLAECEALEKAHPTAQELWPAHFDLLARLNQRDAALAFLRQKLAATPAPSRDVLLAFAGTSARLKLQVEEECYAACEKAHGSSPELAGARAMSLFNAGKPADGLAYIKAAAEGKLDPLWRIVHARYLDIAKDPGAKAVWVSAGEAFPEDLRVQRFMLGSPSVASDHKLQGEVLARLRKIGEPGADVQFAYARWLLQEWRNQNVGKDEAQRHDEHLVEATKVLTTLVNSAAAPVDARLLLASCMEQLKNTSGAIEQLRAVVASPETSQPMAYIDLARLEFARGNTTEARQQLDRLTGTLLSKPDQSAKALADLPPAARILLIDLLAKTSDLARAAQVAELSGDDPDVSLKRVRIYADMGQTQKAEALLAKLLEKPTPAVVEFAVTFYPSIGRPADAQAALARMQPGESFPGTRELVQARYHVLVGDIEKALASYLAAARAKPAGSAPAAPPELKARTWRQLLGLAFALNRKDDFAAYLAEARKEAPNDPSLALLDKHAATITAVPPGNPVGKMLISLLSLTENDDLLPEALGLVKDIADHEAASRKSPALTEASVKEERAREEKFVTRLHALADKNVDAFPLQKLVIEYNSAAGNHDAAVLLASRATQTQPNSPAAWEIAFKAQFAARRFDEAARTSAEWRKRLGPRAIEADMGFAAANLSAGRPDPALERLEPYLAPTTQALASGAPGARAEVVALYCRGLLMRNQVSRAEAILEPLVKSSEQWRALALDLATMLRDPAVAIPWMSKIAALIPAENTTEQGRLGMAWHNLFAATGNVEYRTRAIAVFDVVVPREKVDPNLLFFAGMLYESTARLPDAEKIYRRLIALDAQSPEERLSKARACNNLAMILSRRPEGISEALQLAAQPVALFPRDPNYYDTLAMVCAVAKEWNKGLAAIDTAIALESKNPEWRITKLSLLSQAGKQAELRAEYNKISASDRSALPPSLKQRLDAIQIQ